MNTDNIVTEERCNRWIISHTKRLLIDAKLPTDTRRFKAERVSVWEERLAYVREHGPTDLTVLIAHFGRH